MLSLSLSLSLSIPIQYPDLDRVPCSGLMHNPRGFANGMYWFYFQPMDSRSAIPRSASHCHCRDLAPSTLLHPPYTTAVHLLLPKWQLQRTIPETRIRPGGASMITAPRPVLNPSSSVSSVSPVLLFLLFFSFSVFLSLLYPRIEHSHKYAIAKDYHRYRSCKYLGYMPSLNIYTPPPSHPDATRR